MPPSDDVSDDDLQRLSRDQLVDEARRLRRGIREHRDSTRHELCWHQPALWGLLPEKTDPVPIVPTWPEFLRGCVRYRQSLDEQAASAPRTDEPYRDRPHDDRPRSGVMEAAILWRRLDVPGHDACRVGREEGGWRLDGAAVFRHEDGPARLAYGVACDSAWRTRRGWVRGTLGSRVVELDVAVADGAWRLNGAPAPTVAGCVDLDLGFTPATNVLSLRRLALANGQAAEVRAAWIDLSAGALQPLHQRYEKRSDTAYGYEARAFGYAAELEVLPTGLIRRYPGLWEEER